MRYGLALAAAVLGIAGGAVPADAAIRYRATIQGIGSVDYTAPTFISVSPTDIPNPDAATCSIVSPLSPFPCANIRFLPNPNGFDTLAINYNPLGFPQTIAGSFAAGAFGKVGTYLSADSGLPTSRLTVSAVPEPAAWALLVAGFGVTGAALRRRQAGRTQAA